jgi:hypothetical protein
MSEQVVSVILIANCPLASSLVRASLHRALLRSVPKSVEARNVVTDIVYSPLVPCASAVYALRAYRYQLAWDMTRLMPLRNRALWHADSTAHQSMFRDALDSAKIRESAADMKAGGTRDAALEKAEELARRSGFLDGRPVSAAVTHMQFCYDKTGTQPRVTLPHVTCRARAPTREPGPGPTE